MVSIVSTKSVGLCFIDNLLISDKRTKHLDPCMIIIHVRSLATLLRENKPCLGLVNTGLSSEKKKNCVARYDEGQAAFFLRVHSKPPPAIHHSFLFTN